MTVDAGVHQSRANIVGLFGRKRRQQARSGLDQHDTGGARVDPAEIGCQGLPRDLRDGTRHFNAGRAATDDDERQQAALLIRIGRDLGSLKRNQDAAPDTSCIFDVLQAWCVGRPVIMAEIGMHRAGRDHEIIVRHVAEIGLEQPSSAYPPR